MSLFDQALGAEFAQATHNKQVRKANKQVDKVMGQYQSRDRQMVNIINQQQATLEKQQSIIDRQQATGQKDIDDFKQEKAELQHRIIALQIEVEEYKEMHETNRVKFNKQREAYKQLLAAEEQIVEAYRTSTEDNRILNAKLLNALEDNSVLQQDSNLLKKELEQALEKIVQLESQIGGG